MTSTATTTVYSYQGGECDAEYPWEGCCPPPQWEVAGPGVCEGFNNTGLTIVTLAKIKTQPGLFQEGFPGYPCPAGWGPACCRVRGAVGAPAGELSRAPAGELGGAPAGEFGGGAPAREFGAGAPVGK